MSERILRRDTPHHADPDKPWRVPEGGLYQPWQDWDLRVGQWRLDRRESGPRAFVDLNVGHRGYETIVPPAGEQFSFERDLWAHEIQVSISPTGRSVRVHVNGKEVAR